MQALRQVGGGLFLGLLSLLIVIGGISLSIAEGNALRPSLTFTSTITKSAIPPASAPGETDHPASPIPSASLSPSASPIPPINCPPPTGWVLIITYPGDTLEILATRFHTTPGALVNANCLVSSNLLPGYSLYVPPVPTITPVPCGPPFSWVRYTVQSGDNLYRISQLFRITVTQLQQANCLGYSTTIYTGQNLWVPNVATSTPFATPINIEFDTVTPIPTDTLPPTSPSTNVPPLTTATPTSTSIPPPTETPPSTP